MASSKFFAAGKLFVVLVATGVLASLVVLPYVGGLGLVANKETSRFLDTTCNVDFSKTTTDANSYLYASDGKTLIAKFFSQNRVPVPLSQVNVLTRKALIDTEDRRFYQHHGVDPRGLARAALSESNGDTQGASTLTQQYVKQVRYYQATTVAEQNDAIQQTAARKLVEAKCAIGLEKKYTKDEILQNYFNIAYFGEQSYGIQVAAATYFNKGAKALTVPEAATLAGIVKNPTLYDPFQNPKPALERRNEVIQNMVSAGDLTQTQAAAYEKQPIGVTNAAVRSAARQQGCAYASSAILNVGFFCDYLTNWLQTKGGISKDLLEKGGLRIVSSLNAGQQNSTQQQVWNNFDPNYKTMLAMPQVDPATGHILAMTTSKYYNTANAHHNDPKYTTVPLFTSAATGSGSTFKYFTTVAALNAGMTPDTTLYTSSNYVPRNCPNADPNNPVHNAGNYRSTLTLRDALVESSNTFFVGVENQLFGCNLSTIVQTARNLGVTMSAARAKQIVDENQYNFTLGQTVVSPLDLTVAYSAAANDGVLNLPNPIIKITDSSGRTVKYTKPVPRRVMSQWVARTIINMMIGDTSSNGGTATSQFYPFYNALGQDGHLVASKTGTNNATTNGVDNGQNGALWFVGLTPNLTAATAIYNAADPSETIDLPGIGTNTSDTFGATGAGLAWVPALQPILANRTWQWPDASQIPNAQQVPVSTIVGQDEATAQATIRSAGFTPVRYPVECGSRNPVPGIVASASPAYAAPGQAVYYCMDSGNGFDSAPAPPRTNPTKPSTGATPGGATPGGGATSAPRHR